MTKATEENLGIVMLAFIVLFAASIEVYIGYRVIKFVSIAYDRCKQLETAINSITPYIPKK